MMELIGVILHQTSQMLDNGFNGNLGNYGGYLHTTTGAKGNSYISKINKSRK